MIYDKRDLIVEYIRRQWAGLFNIKKMCFKEQRDFILDKNRFKAAYCSRRAGKTFACAMDLLHTAKTIPASKGLYITLSRASAKKIIWQTLIDLNDKYQLGGTAKLGDLSIVFPNKSIIYLSGANDKTQIERFRGMALHKIYIDEAQAFKSYLNELVNDILEPCLWDHLGKMTLIGTPNSSCKGTFFDVCHKKKIYKNWSVHKWNIRDNTELPFITDTYSVEDFLREKLERQNIDESDPVWQRETLGNWIRSVDSLVFKFDEVKNTFNHTPLCEDYILGADIGFKDKDAIVILGWKDGIVYVVDEWAESENTISTLADKIKEMDKKWSPIKKVIDAGALGKKIVEEIRVRYGINMVAAEKQRKYEFIELVNSDLKQGIIKIREGSGLQEELEYLQYDEKMKIDERFQDDLVDAFLYAFREAKHFAYVPEAPRLVVGSREHLEHQEKLLEEEALKNSQGEEDWFGENDNNF